MSETAKSGFELSFSDMRKLFEASEAEPTVNYDEKILTIDKKSLNYRKVNQTNKNTDQFFKELRASTPITNEELSENSLYSYKSSNYSKTKDQNNCELKILFESSIFQCDKKSTEHSLVEQESLTNIKNDIKVTSQKVGKDSFISGLCSSLSMTSSHQKILFNFLAKEHSIFEVVDLDDCSSVWNHEIKSHKMDIEQRLHQDLNEHINLSACVCFGRIRFRCHKFLLRSSALFRFWEQKLYKFKSDEQLTPLAFSIFYLFAMGKKPEVPSKSLLDVRNAAKILNAADLEKYCMQILDSDLYQENEAFEIFKTAKAHNSLLIKRLMVQRIFKYFLPLIASKDFIEMDVEDVCNLLECDTIGVNSEIEIFYAAILWLNSKWNQRNEKILRRVMSCVRYALIPPWFSYTLKKSTGIFEVDRVIQHKSVLKMIENGASIAATISLYFLDKVKFESILLRLQSKVPRQRLWIYDRNCTYHYGAHEKVSEAVDYFVFIDYLRVLQMEGKNYWRNFQEGSGEHFIKIFCQKFSDTAWSKMRF